MGLSVDRSSQGWFGAKNHFGHSKNKTATDRAPQRGRISELLKKWHVLNQQSNHR